MQTIITIICGSLRMLTAGGLFPSGGGQNTQTPERNFRGFLVLGFKYLFLYQFY